MIIRMSEQKDDEIILTLANQAFGVGYLDPDLLTQISVYVAEEAGKIIGYAMKCITKNEDSQTICSIEQVVVDPAHRRKGVAEMLITQIVNDGIMDDELSVFESNAWEYSDTLKIPLASPLEQCGFQRIRLLEGIYGGEHGDDTPCSVCGSQCVCNAWLYRLQC